MIFTITICLALDHAASCEMDVIAMIIAKRQNTPALLAFERELYARSRHYHQVRGDAFCDASASVEKSLKTVLK